MPFGVRDVAFLRQACERAQEGHCARLDPQFPYFQGARDIGAASAEKAFRTGAKTGGIRGKIMGFLQDVERLGNG